MTIQDVKYLKDNSRENLTKIHIPLDNLFEKKQLFNDVISNVFTIHILNVVIKSDTYPIDYILNVDANDIKMDSILLNQENNINITGREYEKIIINPLAKVSELVFTLSNFNPTDTITEQILSSITGSITLIIRNYEPETEFNNVYNELNPEYNPNVFLNTFSSSSDEEY